MTLYGANGQINLTTVSGSSYTGLQAPDGSYNIVTNTSSSYVGLHHACGALNAFVVTDPSAGYYAKNGSMNVIANAASPSGFSPVQPQGAGAATSLRQVATRTFLSEIADATNKQFMSRRWHFARDNLTSIQLVIANWYVQVGTAGAEVGSGGTLTVTAAIEYPAGVFTQVKFSGSASGVAADGTNLISDSTSISIPTGAVFYTRVFGTASNASVYVSNNSAYAGDQTRGDGFTLAPSGLSDQTMGGTVVTTDSTRVGGCVVAIIATSSVPAAWLAGDSRCFGQGDDSRNYPTGDAGELARSVGPYFAYINAGVDGDQAQWMAANYTKRRVLMGYCPTVAIWQPGINDLNNSQTSTQVLTNLATLYGFHTNSYGATVAPDATSSDGFITVANQTTVASNTQRVALNTSLRGNSNGAKSIFDIAASVESSLNSGKWNISTPNVSFPALTQDGLHENIFACDVIRGNNTVDPNTIIPGTRPTGLNVERVANTNFVRDYSNWNPFNINGGFVADTSTAVWTSGGVVLTVITSKTFPGLIAPLYGLVIGQTYTVSVGITGGTSPGFVRVAVDPQANGTNSVLESGPLSGSLIYGATFVATAKVHYLDLQAFSSTVGQTVTFQNASVKGPT